MSSGNFGQEETGRLLAGRYRVVRQLGRGGMGVVCRAVDEVLGREVAVKELRTFSDASGPELSELRLRMQREARAAARVRHPGVIAVHDVTEDGGRPVIVMELIDGPSLDDVLRERGTLDPREAAAIGAKVMDALDAAHRAGVLHRDVKPGNVLLDRNGRVVLTDFGIAAMDDPDDGATSRLTRTGDVIGSLDYLAPERAQGRPPGPASDIWALGATLYAAVEGSSPFRRTSTWSTLSAIVSEPLPEPRQAGPLASALHALMDKDPQARPDAPSARELLESVASGGPSGVASGEATARTVSGGVAGGGAAVAGAPDPASDPAVRNNSGFGPAPDLSRPVPAVPAAAGTAGAPPRPGGYAATAVPGPGTPPAGGRAQRRAGHRRGRTVLAAAAVVAVLAGSGVVVASLNGHGLDFGSGSAEAGRTAADGRTAAPGGTGDPGGKNGDADDGKKSPKPSGSAEESPDEKPAGAGGTAGEDGGDAGGGEGGDSGGTDGGSSGSGSGGGSGGSDSGGSGSGGGDSGGGDGGQEPAPAPVCDSIGGGKYNCTVWRTAESYDGAGNHKGTLNAGTNYFFCQTMGRRETHGEWTNVWWARTDDDSGNTGVYVSVVYIKGGDNDQPVPGLPTC